MCSVKTSLKVVASSIALLFICNIVAYLLYNFVFAAATETYEHLWRSMDSMHWKVGMPLVVLLEGVIYSIWYIMVSKCSYAGKRMDNGLIFGFFVWLVTWFIGGLSTYVMSPYPFVLIIAMWLHGIIRFTLWGLIIDKVIRLAR